MVCLLLWAIAIVALLVFMKTKSAAKKTGANVRRPGRQNRHWRMLARFSRMGVVIFFLLAIVYTVYWVCTAVLGNRDSETDYTADKICVWGEELYHGQEDPGVLVMTVEKLPDAIPEPEGEQEEGSGEKEPSEIKGGNGISEPDKSYDYMPLMLFGKYQFGQYLTETDLANMKIKFDEYWSREAYWEMLEEIAYDPGQDTELMNQIMKFDKETQNNGGTLTAEEYFGNAEDRLCYYYGDKVGRLDFLEQSAISAEGAVELEYAKNPGEYEKLFRYIRETVIRFSCVLGSDCEQYFSGGQEDVKYRAGKALYKLVANGKKMEVSDYFYSLCSTYLFLKEAFDYSTPDSKYAVEIAYYYFRVCADMIQAMEPEKTNDMKERVWLAYYQFRERQKSDAGNSTYIVYYEEVETVMKSIESILE